MYKIEYHKKALKQIKNLQNNKKLLARLEEILQDIATDPFSERYKFERLKHNLSGYCSKRLDKKNRVLYQVLEDRVVVLVVSVLGHYE